MSDTRRIRLQPDFEKGYEEAREELRDEINNFKKKNQRLREELRKEKEMAGILHSELCTYCQRKVGKKLEELDKE